MLARKKTGAIAAIASGVILAAVLTGSASAGASTPGCHGDENAGAAGVKCIDRVTDVLGAAGVHINATVSLPSCPDATTALVQAKIIVAGLNGHGGTSKRLADAQAASDKAHKLVRDAEAADKAEDAKDAARDKAQSVYDAALKDDTTEDTATPLVPDVTGSPDAKDKARTNALAALDAAKAADPEVGPKEDPDDTEDAAVAVAKSNAFDADQRLHKAQIAEGTAEQAVVDAEVVIGQACPKTPPPAPPTSDSPAPQPPIVEGGNPGPITIIDGQAPVPQPVQSNLPVTG